MSLGGVLRLSWITVVLLVAIWAITNALPEGRTEIMHALERLQKEPGNPLRLAEKNTLSFVLIDAAVERGLLDRVGNAEANRELLNPLPVLHFSHKYWLGRDSSCLSALGAEFAREEEGMFDSATRRAMNSVLKRFLPDYERAAELLPPGTIEEYQARTSRCPIILMWGGTRKLVEYTTSVETEPLSRSIAWTMRLDSLRRLSPSLLFLGLMGIAPYPLLALFRRKRRMRS